MNQNGHADYSGLLWLFLIAIAVAFAIELGLILLAVKFWHVKVFNIVFLVLSACWLLFLIAEGWKIFR